MVVVETTLTGDDVEEIVQSEFYPFLTNGFDHHYHLDEPTFILGASGVILKFYLTPCKTTNNKTTNKFV